MLNQGMIHGVRVEELVAFVRSIAYTLVRRLPLQVRVSDLISAGKIGLFEARDRFDPARGRDFKTFAEYRIRGAMLDALRALDHLSRGERAHASRIARVERELTLELGRPPEDDELVLALGLSLAQLYAQRECESAARTLSLDDLMDGGEDPVVEDEDVEDALIRQFDARRQVERVIACLDARRARIVSLYHGDDLTLRKIGKRLGVTESRVCQLLGEARVVMRANRAP